jgi:hypothetical protein
VQLSVSIHATTEMLAMGRSEPGRALPQEVRAMEYEVGEFADRGIAAGLSSATARNDVFLELDEGVTHAEAIVKQRSTPHIKLGRRRRPRGRAGPRTQNRGIGFADVVARRADSPRTSTATVRPVGSGFRPEDISSRLGRGRDRIRAEGPATSAAAPAPSASSTRWRRLPPNSASSPPRPDGGPDSVRRHRPSRGPGVARRSRLRSVGSPSPSVPSGAEGRVTALS